MDTSPVKSRAQKYFGTYLIVIFFIISFGIGVSVGRTWNVKNQISSASSSTDVANILNPDRSVNKSGVEFDQFWEVWDKIKNKYVKQSSDETAMLSTSRQRKPMNLPKTYLVSLRVLARRLVSKRLN